MPGFLLDSPSHHRFLLNPPPPSPSASPSASPSPSPSPSPPLIMYSPLPSSLSSSPFDPLPPLSPSRHSHPLLLDDPTCTSPPPPPPPSSPSSSSFPSDAHKHLRDASSPSSPPPPSQPQRPLPRSKLGMITPSDLQPQPNSDSLPLLYPNQSPDLIPLNTPSPRSFKPSSLSSPSASNSFSADGIPGSPVFSDLSSEAIAASLQRFLPSNHDDDQVWPPVGAFPAMSDVYSCDDFRMYEFKVRKCMRARSHDWTECPFAHPGEKARRRDPRRFHYSGSACPEFRKGVCKKGDSCEFSHGVFECWLHPARYRTQPCKDGRNCRRRVCFFAHTVEQLRVLPSPSPSSSVPSLSSSLSSSSSADSPRVTSSSSSAATATASVSAAFDGSPWRQAMASAHFVNIDGDSSPSYWRQAMASALLFGESNGGDSPSTLGKTTSSTDLSFNEGFAACISNGDSAQFRQALSSSAYINEGLSNNSGDEVFSLASAINNPRLLQKVADHHHISSPTSILQTHSHGHSHSRCSPSSSRSPSSSPPLSPEGSLCHLRSLSAYSHVHHSSPLSSSSLPVPDHRRHLNRLQSVPTISIPQNATDLTEISPFDHREFPFVEYSASSPSLASSPRTGIVNPNTDLANYLQCLHLRSKTLSDLQRSRSNPVSPDYLNHHHRQAQLLSLLQNQQQPSSGASCPSQSYGSLLRGFPGTPDGTSSNNGSFYGKLKNSSSVGGKESNGEGVEMAKRVESGRDLRANFYGKIGKENGVAIRAEINPDLGWVNELVK